MPHVDRKQDCENNVTSQHGGLQIAHSRQDDGKAAKARARSPFSRFAGIAAASHGSHRSSLRLFFNQLVRQ